MANVLAAAHSYTLVRPQGGEKIVVKRGQTIDHLEDEDRQYLASKSVSPPMSDDSHSPVGRVAMFQQVVDEDVKGEAVIDAAAPVAATSDSPYAGGAPKAKEKVVVQVTAADDDAGDDGEAAGGDDGGGDDTEPAPAPKAKAKKKTGRKSTRGKAKPKAKSKKS